MKFERTVAVYIINSKNQVLMLKHKKINSWLPPGGHVEKNELMHQAAEREVMEETGIHVEFIYSTEILNNECDDRARLLPRPLVVQLENMGDHYHEDFVYLAKAGNDKIINYEEHEIRWFDFIEIFKLDIFDNVRRHLNYIENFISK